MNVYENVDKYKYDDRDYCFDVIGNRCLWEKDEKGRTECSLQSISTIASYCPNFSDKRQEKIKELFRYKNIEFVPRKDLKSILKDKKNEIKNESDFFRTITVEPFSPYPIIFCTKISLLDAEKCSDLKKSTSLIATVCPNIFSLKKQKKIALEYGDVHFVPVAEYPLARMQFGDIGSGRFKISEEFVPFREKKTTE